MRPRARVCVYISAFIVYVANVNNRARVDAALGGCDGVDGGGGGAGV